MYINLMWDLPAKGKSVLDLQMFDQFDLKLAFISVYCSA